MVAPRRGRRARSGRPAPPNSGNSPSGRPSRRSASCHVAAEGVEQVEHMPGRQVRARSSAARRRAVGVRIVALRRPGRASIAPAREVSRRARRRLVGHVVGRPREAVEGQHHRPWRGAIRNEATGKFSSRWPLPEARSAAVVMRPSVRAAMAWARPFHMPPRAAPDLHRRLMVKTRVDRADQRQGRGPTAASGVESQHRLERQRHGAQAARPSHRAGPSANTAQQRRGQIDQAPCRRPCRPAAAGE